MVLPMAARQAFVVVGVVVVVARFELQMHDLVPRQMIIATIVTDQIWECSGQFTVK